MLAAAFTCKVSCAVSVSREGSMGSQNNIPPPARHDTNRDSQRDNLLLGTGEARKIASNERWCVFSFVKK